METIKLNKFVITLPSGSVYCVVTDNIETAIEYAVFAEDAGLEPIIGVEKTITFLKKYELN